MQLAHSVIGGWCSAGARKFRLHDFSSGDDLHPLSSPGSSTSISNPPIHSMSPRQPRPALVPTESRSLQWKIPPRSQYFPCGSATVQTKVPAAVNKIIVVSRNSVLLRLSSRSQLGVVARVPNLEKSRVGPGWCTNSSEPWPRAR